MHEINEIVQELPPTIEWTT